MGPKRKFVVRSGISGTGSLMTQPASLAWVKGKAQSRARGWEGLTGVGEEFRLHQPTGGAVRAEAAVTAIAGGVLADTLCDTREGPTYDMGSGQVTFRVPP